MHTIEQRTVASNNLGENTEAFSHSLGFRLNAAAAEAEEKEQNRRRQFVESVRQRHGCSTASRGDNERKSTRSPMCKAAGRRDEKQCARMVRVIFLSLSGLAWSESDG